MMRARQRSGNRSRHHRFRRFAGVALLVAAAAALIAMAPRALRRMAAFRVTRVEVVGTRHLAPHRALDVSGITKRDNVFDDPSAWRGALERLPIVDRVQVGRRLPGTIVLRITEIRPVAWVRTPELRLVTAAGRILSVGPGGGADLPVLSLPAGSIEDGRVRGGRALRMIHFLSELRATEPRLAARVSEARVAGANAVRLVLREPAGAEVLLPLDVGANRLRAVRLTLADLARRNELEELKRVDLRYREQVVVSFGANGTG